ncbi:substrate-binding domain-containing protein [Aeromicrobium sp. Leaf350]|uniref:sugar ABC transporter substrate-binding protein n=1 Tax=Aeromicrobium sp. Leaf350 TaxID=2876565 RepID=UPI001E42E6E7|nr:substrate-binding domain-containing protein [Aeromicrobium sp. Leaf350]
MNRVPLNRTGWRWLAMTLTATLALSACGSSSDSASGGSGGGDQACIDAAAEQNAEYASLPTKIAEGFTALGAAPTADGSIIALAVGSLPNDVGPAESAVEAAEAIGWTGKVISHDGSVEDVNEKLQEAIDEKPTAIVMQGTNLDSISGSLAKAEEAGVIVAVGSGDVEPQGTTGYAGTFNAANNFDLKARAMSAWILNDSGCSTNALMVGLPYPILKTMGDSFVASYEETCSDCTAEYQELPLAQVGTPAATTAIVSSVQADPSIGYVVVQDSVIATGLRAALDQAGLNDVKITGITPDAQAYSALKNGTNSMWMLNSLPFVGYVMVDTVLRVLDTGEPVAAIEYPTPVLTKENLPEGADSSLAIPEDFREQFLEVWGVK